MTFLELQNQVAYWLDDLNFGYFTPVQVKSWLNNAQYEVQKLLLQAGENYYLKRVQTTLVIGQNDYVLPDGFLKLHRLEIVTSGLPPNENTTPMAPITVNQQDLVPGMQGTPQFYYLKKNRITLLPAPDSNLTLRLWYSPIVTQMVLDSDTPNCPEQYHEYIAVLATWDGLLKDGRETRPMKDKLAYYESMLKADAAERQQDTPRSIVSQGMGYNTDSYGYW